ncbi:MAG: Tol-Pal system beta propeller repeat protein TolB [Myxococcales bacterium]|nr:Tol-Pal system beta propeller repeat protein TolB [Myxococcales bacterium]
MQRYLHALIALIAFSSRPALAQESPRRIIDVTNPEFRSYAIAIPFVKAEAGAEAPAKDLTDQLRWNLGASALFRVLDPKSFLADPIKEGITAPTIRFEDWLNVGAEGLIKGGVQIGPAMQVVLRFFDVASGRQLLEKKYEGSPEQAKSFADDFSNAVVELLTGTRGVFGTKIAAVRKLKSGREIWVIGMDGSGARPVTSNGAINMLPAWFADGRSLLFTSIQNHNPNMYRVPADGGRPAVLSSQPGLNAGGAVSPDGSRIALTMTRDGNSEIYTMSPDGSALTRLTDHWAIDSSPTWSPDGQRIAFVSARFGDPHIFIMNADGTNLQRLTDRGNYNQTPDWSPRGNLIVFTARDERNVFDLFTVDPNTREIRRLTQDQGNNEEPSFSPDGQHIVFTSTREGSSQLWIMAVDGTKQLRLTQEGGYLTPDWSPRALSGAAP